MTRDPDSGAADKKIEDYLAACPAPLPDASLKQRVLAAGAAAWKADQHCLPFLLKLAALLAFAAGINLTVNLIDDRLSKQNRSQAIAAASSESELNRRRRLLAEVGLDSVPHLALVRMARARRKPLRLPENRLVPEPQPINGG